MKKVKQVTTKIMLLLSTLFVLFISCNKQALEDAEAEILALKAEVATLSYELNVQINNNTEYSTRLVNANATIRNLTSELNNLEVINTFLESQNAELNTTIRTLRANLQELTLKIADMNIQLSEHHDELHGHLHVDSDDDHNHIDVAYVQEATDIITELETEEVETIIEYITVVETIIEEVEVAIGTEEDAALIAQYEAEIAEHLDTIADLQALVAELSDDPMFAEFMSEGGGDDGDDDPDVWTFEGQPWEDNGPQTGGVSSTINNGDPVVTYSVSDDDTVYTSLSAAQEAVALGSTVTITTISTQAVSITTTAIVQPQTQTATLTIVGEQDETPAEQPADNTRDNPVSDAASIVGEPVISLTAVSFTKDSPVVETDDFWTFDGQPWENSAPQTGGVSSTVNNGEPVVTYHYNSTSYDSLADAQTAADVNEDAETTITIVKRTTQATTVNTSAVIQPQTKTATLTIVGEIDPVPPVELDDQTQDFEVSAASSEDGEDIVSNVNVTYTTPAAEDEADEFVYGDYEGVGVPPAAVTEVVTGTWVIAVAPHTEEFTTQSRVVTTTTTIAAYSFTQTQTVEIQINGAEDVPPLDIADATPLSQVSLVEAVVTVSPITETEPIENPAFVDIVASVSPSVVEAGDTATFSVEITVNDPDLTVVRVQWLKQNLWDDEEDFSGWPGHEGMSTDFNTTAVHSGRNFSMKAKVTFSDGNTYYSKNEVAFEVEETPYAISLTNNGTLGVNLYLGSTIRVTDINIAVDTDTATLNGFYVEVLIFHVEDGDEYLMQASDIGAGSLNTTYMAQPHIGKSIGLARFEGAPDGFYRARVRMVSPGGSEAIIDGTVQDYIDFP